MVLFQIVPNETRLISVNRVLLALLICWNQTIHLVHKFWFDVTSSFILNKTLHKWSHFRWYLFSFIIDNHIKLEACKYLSNTNMFTFFVTISYHHFYLIKGFDLFLEKFYQLNWLTYCHKVIKEIFSIQLIYNCEPVSLTS